VSHFVVQPQGPAQTGDGSQGSDPLAAAPGGARQPTGDPAVDDALAKLDAVSEAPLDTQIEVIEQVHRVLQGRLGDLATE
jgi:hypothetical protein